MRLALVATPHFFVDELEAPRVGLSDEDSKHALRSLRLRPGDELSLADGRGAVARGRLLADRSGVASVEVLEVWHVQAPPPDVCVVLSPPSGERLAWAVQKLGELGVARLVLVQTKRSVRRWDQDRAEQVVPRLRSIAKEAAMQSRQAFVMEVEAGLRLADALAAPTLLLWEGATRPLTAAFPEDPPSVRLVVGPEGGFEQHEVEQAAEAGAGIVSLGPQILRSETAAVVGAALVLARYGRLG